MGEVIPITQPLEMSATQIEAWELRLGYWALKRGDALVALKYAEGQYEDAMRMLGRLPVEVGLQE